MKRFVPAILFLLLAAPCAASLNQPGEAKFKATRLLPLPPDEVLPILEGAMEEIGVDYADPERGEVVSRYQRLQMGPNTFRRRIIAVATQRSGGTIVNVKAPSEVLMDALTPGAFRPVERWRVVGSDTTLEQEFIAQVESAAGLEASPAPGESGAPGAAPAVLPLAWAEIQKLKEERAALLAPIRGFDERALAILYAEDLDERRAELEGIREERERLWSEALPRLKEIDRRILELVLAE
jgi:hypothetical protein